MKPEDGAPAQNYINSFLQIICNENSKTLYIHQRVLSNDMVVPDVYGDRDISRYR